MRGLHNDYRWPGIGSALVVALKHVQGEQEAAYTMVPSSLKMAATAFLRMDDVEAGIASGRVEGALALFTTQESTSVTVGGREVPLEFAAVVRPGLHPGGIRRSTHWSSRPCSPGTSPC